MQNLYRHFDKYGRLLYVGISLSALHRLGQHKHNASWFSAIETVKIEQCQDRESALKKERLAIKKEKPRYNIMHSTNTPSLYDTPKHKQFIPIILHEDGSVEICD